MNRAGATVPIHSIKACVVYDTASGQIHHRHHVLTLVGGREPGHTKSPQMRFGRSGSLPKPPGGVLDVLHVHHDAMESGKRYRVDLRTKALALQE